MSPAPAVWRGRPREPGSHPELGGRLARGLSPAEEDDRWHFAHSPERHLTVTEHCSHSSNRWCRPQGFWEEGGQRGVAGLGRWHSTPHRLSFEGHQRSVLVDTRPAHRAREVIRTSCPPCCAGPGVQTHVSWRTQTQRGLRDSELFNALKFLFWKKK